MSAYTVEGTREAEARVGLDLDRIVSEAREVAAADDLLAVFLLGGYARGEGAVVRTEDGDLRGWNDYDLLLVFERPPEAERYRDLARRLAGELGIDFVDLGLATPRDLDGAPPTLFWYELGEAHRILWRKEGSGVAPRSIPVDTLDPAEGSRLLLNRGLALLWAALRLWPHGRPGEGIPSPDPGEIRFSAIAAHKAILAAGDAALLRHRRYDVRQEERTRRLVQDPALWTPWGPRGFIDAYRRAAEFRRKPWIGTADETAALWGEARAIYEDGLRAAETERLGPFPDWTAHARRARRAASPGSLRRWLRRVRRGGPPEEAWLWGRLDTCLLDPGTKSVEAWRRRSLDAVRAWHP